LAGASRSAEGAQLVPVLIFSLFLFFPALITAYLVPDRHAATPATP
jgi:hypothetical protein